VGVEVAERDSRGNNDPPPHPSPTRGEGADRIRGSGVESDASPAGLTRGSIILRKNIFPKGMDGRVKPGHDDSL